LTVFVPGASHKEPSDLGVEAAFTVRHRFRLPGCSGAVETDNLKKMESVDVCPEDDGEHVADLPRLSLLARGVFVRCKKASHAPMSRPVSDGSSMRILSSPGPLSDIAADQFGLGICLCQSMRALSRGSFVCVEEMN
jgi:hypothetical protein